MNYKILIIGALIAILLISNVAAAPTTLSPLPDNQIIRISAETGENYITWNWKLDSGGLVSVPVSIYIDDSAVPTRSNYTRTSYTITDLKPDERHNIAIYTTVNGTSTLGGKATITTLKSAYVVYFMILFCFMFMILCIFIDRYLSDMWIFVIMSMFNIIICLFGAGMASGHGITPYIMFGIAILTGLIMLIEGLPKLREEISWL